jgi:predicted amidophosphoribosyltransferase
VSMTTCTSCGSEVTGKKFCPRCGAAVQPVEPVQVESQFCPHCNGEVKPGAAFCMHCGTSLHSQQVSVAAAPSMPQFCPSCNTEVSGSAPFCTNCGNNLRTAPHVAAAPASLACANCGRQNTPDMRFCGGCGNALGATPNVQPNYMPSGQYTQSPQPQQYQQPQYAQSPYPPQQQYPQQYAQGGYQPQPMMGQSPMMLRCPVCMAMAPVGSPACVSCHTSLAGVIPTPANAMPMQGQQGGLGGFMQGNAGKYAMGALGGAAAVLGGEMLMNGVENRIEGDMGYGGGGGYGHHHHRQEGLLGGLGELADDIGL